VVESRIDTLEEDAAERQDHLIPLITSTRAQQTGPRIILLKRPPQRLIQASSGNVRSNLTK